MAAAVGCLLGAVVVVRPDWLERIDRPVSGWVRGTTLQDFFLFWTQFGSQREALLIGAVLAVAIWRRNPALAVALPAALTSAVVVDLTVKTIVDRPRPPDPVVGTALGSFPSGHAMTAVVAFGLLPRIVLVLTRSRPAFWISVPTSIVVAVLVIVSRVYLGAHWPSDVVASTFLGAALLLLTDAVLESHTPRGPQPLGHRPGHRPGH